MIKIIIDSSADLLKDEIQHKGVTLVPLQVNINGINYQDGVNLEHDQFYELLVNTNEFPKTSQPSPNDFVTLFEEIKENKDQAICILLSSALSGTCQSALLAKNIVDYDDIYIIDSLTAVAAIRILVDKALSMVQDGSDCKTIVATLNELKSHIKIFAGLNTLEYLAKGGRIPKGVATIADFTKLKPIITVSNEGKVEVIGKRIGIKKAITYILEQLQSTSVDSSYPFYSLYTYGNDNIDLLESKLSETNINIAARVQVGPTVGSHIGPNVFGVCFVEKY